MLAARLLFLLCLLMPTLIRAQSDSLLQQDIELIEFTANRTGQWSNALRYQLDSSLQNLSLHQQLGQWLAFNTEAYIRANGPGNVATISLRGGNPAHTNVLLNGVSLNSPMLGLCDVSQLPVHLFSDVQLQTGASGALLGSGTVSGALMLQLEPSQQPLLSANMQLGSASTYNGFVKFSPRLGPLKLSVGAYGQQSENDFRFRNHSLPESPLQRQIHAAYGQWGILSGLTWQRGKHTLQATYWRHAQQRLIPPSMTQASSAASQADAQNRVLLNWQIKHRKGFTRVAAAYMHEYIRYTDTLIRLDARSNAHQFLLQAEHQRPLNQFMQLLAELNLNHTFAQTDNYLGLPQRSRLAAATGLRLFSGKLSWTNLLRLDYVLGYQPVLVPHSSFSWYINPNWRLDASAARTYRLPTFNDLYWFEAAAYGNPNLKPEFGQSYDLGLSQSLKPSPKLGIQLRQQFFYNRLHQQILWQQQDDSRWTPLNIERTRSFGATLQASAQVQQGKLMWSFRASYSFVQATRTAGDARLIGKILPYTPQHRANASIGLQHAHFTLLYQHDITGSRFTNASNSKALKAFSLGRLSAQYKLPIRKWPNLYVHANIENLWNTAYQAIQWQAMPGRQVTVGVRCEL